MEPFIGEIKLFGGDFAPRGWFFCDGTLLDINRYNRLFSILQTYYGGDGMQTFALPDLRGRAAVQPGKSPSAKTVYTLGIAAGEEEHAITTQQLPSHSHRINAVSAAATSLVAKDFLPATSPSDPESGAGVNIYGSGTPDVQMHQSAISNTGDGQPLKLVSPVLPINYIIAWDGIYPSRP